MPQPIEASIERAIAILRRAGATQVYLFGSASQDGSHPADIDLAVEGLPPTALFRVVGELMCELGVLVDVIDLDRPTPFVRRLRESGRLRRVA